MLVRTAFIDVQDKEGLHFWAGVDEWNEPDGRSRRVDFKRLDSWAACREFQLDYNVQSKYVGVDLGHRYREVLKKCAEWHWYGYKGDDALTFPHWITEKKGKPKTLINRPWSETKLADSMSGVSVDKSGRVRRPKWAITIDWSNPYFYPILYALKKGEGRYYGIPKDMPEEYLNQLNSMVPKWEKGKLVWTCIGRDGNHAWDVACGNLVIATRAGLFKIEDETPTKETK